MAKCHKSLLMRRAFMPRRIKPKKARVSHRLVRNRNKPSKSSDKGAITKKNRVCPTVGIGGSAGGFEAARELLRHLPPRTGMAFVIVQHLDPHHTSRLAGLLGTVTEMPVLEVLKQVRPEPNTVYVQPPTKCLILKNGALTLVKRTERLNLAIDHFFESLAEEQRSRAATARRDCARSKSLAASLSLRTKI